MRRGWAVRNGIGLIRCNSMKEKLRKKQEERIWFIHGKIVRGGLRLSRSTKGLVRVQRRLNMRKMIEGKELGEGCFLKGRSPSTPFPVE